MSLTYIDSRIAKYHSRLLLFTNHAPLCFGRLRFRPEWTASTKVRLRSITSISNGPSYGQGNDTFRFEISHAPTGSSRAQFGHTGLPPVQHLSQFPGLTCVPP
jgi:hypothetical protein